MRVCLCVCVRLVVCGVVASERGARCHPLYPPPPFGLPSGKIALVDLPALLRGLHFNPSAVDVEFLMQVCLPLVGEPMFDRRLCASPLVPPSLHPSHPFPFPHPASLDLQSFGGRDEVSFAEALAVVAKMPREPELVDDLCDALSIFDKVGCRRCCCC